MGTDSEAESRWQFAIDVGGTFTDVIAVDPQGRLHTLKTLSSGTITGEQLASCGIDWTSPSAGRLLAGWACRLDGDAMPLERAVAIASPDGDAAIELSTGESSVVTAVRLLTRTSLDKTLPAVELRLGTTRGTNTLLERRGARVGLLTTAGFGDVLSIGNQDRPDLFALDVTKPHTLTHRSAEIIQRIGAAGEELIDLDRESVAAAVAAISDCDSIAVSFVNAYQNGSHERAVRELAEPTGKPITLGSEVSAEPKFVGRTQTAVLNAYLAPALRDYLRTLGEALPGSSIMMMTSDGALVSVSRFRGTESVLSGPAGGVVAVESLLRDEPSFDGAIAFDMGGTSTDVSRVDRIAGVSRQHESIKAGVTIAAPSLAIETVAAGGGSICRFDGVKLVVGPESAGADPGPACYGRGGPLTVTDCNVLLGHLDDTGTSRSISVGAARAAAEAVRATIPGQPLSVEELAEGCLTIANENMAAEMRRVSVARGFDPSRDMLVTFGGAGGQHACAVAERLGCREVRVPKFAGVLSALGIHHARVSRSSSRTLLCTIESIPQDVVQETARAATDCLSREGIDCDAVERSALVRYAGTESPLDVGFAAADCSDLRERFESAYRKTFGSLRDRAIEVVSIRVRAIGMAAGPRDSQEMATGLDWSYEGARLTEGSAVPGPACISNRFTTVYVQEGWTAVATGDALSLSQSDGGGTSERVDGVADVVRLELDSNRFASIVELAGETLRRTSLSPNVKERLDFSVALFDAAGRLVVNAPHIPVHLGAMGRVIEHLIERSAGQPFRPGDVIATNDPATGGSHLPDLTIVTPVFLDDSGPAFFIASRAHHAEIGGTVPGSLPPNATTLAEEGVVISNVLLFAAGEDRIDAFRELLTTGPYPSRTPDDNIADALAQVACNRQAADALASLSQSIGADRVRRSIEQMHVAASNATRAALQTLHDSELRVATQSDALDDGSIIRATVSIDADGSAHFDFSGTAPVARSNLNANPGIVTAAVLYVLRLLIGRVDSDAASLPLNSGVLEPVRITIPPGLLNPFDDPETRPASELPAVVGGNTETSQRIVDVLLAALRLASCSQGTMNNVVFGDETFGYYETIGGGSGATAERPGCDAVQVHMTNTRMTDVEVLEHRLPVHVRRFAVRTGSGGEGRHRGGDGIIRELEFLRPLELSLVTGRRTTAPRGLSGGGDGASGGNTLIRVDGTEVPLSYRCGVRVAAGDVLRIETPGGGGYGSPE